MLSPVCICCVCSVLLDVFIVSCVVSSCPYGYCTATVIYCCYYYYYYYHYYHYHHHHHHHHYYYYYYRIYVFDWQ